ALPRFESPAAEQPRHTREVVALEPAAWSGPAPAAEAPARSGSDRWRALRRWDAAESSAESAPTEVPIPPSATVADQATGPELPVGARPALALVGSGGPPGNGRGELTDEETDRAVAGLTEIDEPSAPEGGA